MRDCKPANCLYSVKTGEAKLCDMGSSKELIKGEPNVSYICSRFYRAPELLFAATEYSVAIDMWSVGAIFGEMLNGGSPIFPGQSSVDQLVEIIKLLGTPTQQEILAMNPSYTEFKFPLVKPQPLTRLFKGRLGSDALDLITGLLQYDPNLRLTAVQALTHKYFDELRNSAGSTKIHNIPLPQSLFNFNTVESAVLGPVLLPKLSLGSNERLGGHNTTNVTDQIRGQALLSTRPIQFS